MDSPFVSCSTLFHLLVISTLWTAAVASETEDGPEAFVVDEIAPCVVFLDVQRYIFEKDGEGTTVQVFHFHPQRGFQPKLESGGATGFLVSHNEVVYLVTAKHVIEHAHSTTIRYNRQDGSVGKQVISAIEKECALTQWVLHPESDLAVHPIEIHSLPGVTARVFRSGGFLEKPRLLDRLVAIGFPYTLGSDLQNESLSPVAAEFTVASSRTAGLPGVASSQILIDPALSPGFSGAPLFSLDEPPGAASIRKKKVKLVGIGAGYVPVAIRTRGTVEKFLGRIVPAKDLTDLLNSPEVKAYEKASKAGQSEGEPPEGVKGATTGKEKQSEK